jgi:hypothetical protein
MSNCSCNGLNENCYYCLGSGIKRNLKKRAKFIIIEPKETNTNFNNSNLESQKSNTNRLNIDNLKSTIKSYSSNTLKKYKNLLLNEVTDSVHNLNNQKLLEIIDFVTLELVSRLTNSKSNINKKKTPTRNNTKNRVSPLNKGKKKSKKKLKNLSNTQNKIHSSKETLLGNKLSNHFKQNSHNQVEKKLDGSRDFYQFRESGKFGSHSLYDDHGEESFG